MCRSIKPLRTTLGDATPDEIREAALQYVRKVSGIQRPTAVTAPAFEAAVAACEEATARLIASLPPSKRQPTQPRPRR